MYALRTELKSLTSVLKRKKKEKKKRFLMANKSDVNEAEGFSLLGNKRKNMSCERC